MFKEIRPEGSMVSSEAIRQKARDYAKAKRAEKKAMKLATGKIDPKIAIQINEVVDDFDADAFHPRSQNPKPNLGGRPKSVVNKVTEYGALFNKLNDERTAKGLPPLKTAMEVLIDAMQSDELDIKDKAKIADKLAPFESSRAPIISVEHIQNVTREDEGDAEEALNEFLDSLRKV
jgi:hypothetical protein